MLEFGKSLYEECPPIESIIQMKDIENFADRQRDVEAVQKLAKPRTKPYRDHAGGVVPDLAGDLHENIFTKSRAVKLSFDSHQSHTSQQLGPQLTDPESISLDAFRQERPESDLEARCGSSNSNHSESSLESSLSSMDLRNVLPRPTTQDEIREIGHLLPKPLRHFEASELQPSTDHEAQVVTESIDRTLGEFGIQHFCSSEILC